MALQPSLAEAHFNLANGLYCSGRWEEAIAEYRQATQLKPQFAPAWYQLGNALAAHDRLDEAIEALRQAATLQPQHAEAWYNLAHALHRAQRNEEAIAASQQAIAIKPDFIDAYVNLGSTLQELDRQAQAMEVYQQALKIKPDSAELLCNLGSALYKLDRDDEAMESYRKAVASRPDCREAWHNGGNAWERRGNFEEAESAYQKALAINPNSSESLNSLGSLYYHRRRLPEAEGFLKKAVAANPNHAPSVLNLGLMRLIVGNLEEGLINYEARFEANKLSRTRGFPQPLWDGSDLNGKRICLHTEQGLGDAIHFLRYVPMVQARGGRVVLRTWHHLKRLFTGQLGIEEVFDERDPAVPFDVQYPLVSLAPLFRTTLQTIPADVPYLTARPELLEKWRAKLEEEEKEIRNPNVEIRNKSEIQKENDQNAGLENSNFSNSNLFRISDFEFRASRPFRVGLVWAGNRAHIRDRERSIRISMFAPLAEVKDVRFHSLQLGPASVQAKDPPDGMELVDFTSELKDMAETAALIENLDLVIAVDTSVLHLAGALAKPAWVLLAYIPDWRWLLDRPDSPWYPTLKLFRQSQPGEWNEPIERLAEELNALVQRRKSGDRVSS